MASERTLAHFISGPQVHTYDATTVLLSVFESKGGVAIPGIGVQTGQAADLPMTGTQTPFGPNRD
jgi:hypothetical protein